MKAPDREIPNRETPRPGIAGWAAQLNWLIAAGAFYFCFALNAFPVAGLQAHGRHRAPNHFLVGIAQLRQGRRIHVDDCAALGNEKYGLLNRVDQSLVRGPPGASQIMMG